MVQGSSANAEETEQQSPAAIVEEVIEVIRAAFISERYDIAMYIQREREVLSFSNS